MTNKHPECGPDEVFVTNADDVTWKHIGWKTKRKGCVAYTRSGKEIGSEWRGCFPVFASKSEIAESAPKLLKFLEDDD